MFIFRLQKALEHREDEEDRLKKEFLLKKNRLDQEKEILVEASKLIDKTIHEFNSLRTGTLNPISLKNYETYLKKIKRDKKNQEGIVSEWHRLTEQAKDNFVEGRKEKKVLEKL